MKIFRYEIPFGHGYHRLNMPSGAKVVNAVYQSARPAFSVYAEVPTASEFMGQTAASICQPREAREFYVVATGDAVPKNARHIRSIVLPDGFSCFHIYEALT